MSNKRAIPAEFAEYVKRCSPLNIPLMAQWPTSRKDALAIQAETTEKVDLTPFGSEPGLIAAVDTAYGYGGLRVYAAAVITTFPDIEIVEKATASWEVSFPYVPGLLFFREGPAIVEALTGLKKRPDFLIVHGHGVAHPRQCGMASHIGILFDLPTVGCCRKILSGRHRPVGAEKGSFEPIQLNHREVGRAYRSKANVKPIFISPAFHCDLAQAQDVIVRNLRGFRLPEPLRLAHLFANKYKRRMEKDPNSDARHPGDEIQED